MVKRDNSKSDFTNKKGSEKTPKKGFGHDYNEGSQDEGYLERQGVNDDFGEDFGSTRGRNVTGQRKTGRDFDEETMEPRGVRRNVSADIEDEAPIFEEDTEEEDVDVDIEDVYPRHNTGKTLPGRGKKKNL